ncbi:putative porin [Psychroserpens sp. Hel_I_66]|uniref:putative porin n=1 Tax=Psychroserpens sp. Hel_I_66 TaxID=1250004 RepID=UPI000648DE15|nr:putative porin [Psychroserpens sp. Hel_I_66]
MKVLLYVFLFITLPQISYTQIREIKENKSEVSIDSTKSNSKKFVKNNGKEISDRSTIDNYIVIQNDGSFKILDTSLTIQKEYKFNYLRKDNFGLLQFANLGQTYNSLTKDFSNNNLAPLFGARARHFNYLEVEDIKYYEVPTPLTELFFKTAFQQGQLLDAFFTVNTSKQFNFSIAYKGMRSLGNYQQSLTSTGNLRMTANYKTKDLRYKVKSHIATQDLLNQENGGLTDEDTQNFISGNEDFIDRSVFDPNFDNAESTLIGKRFYLDHEYSIIPEKDSLGKSVKIRNIVNFEDKNFQFSQTLSDPFFGDSFNQSNIRDKVTLENFETKLHVNYTAPIIGEISLGAIYNDINYGYDQVTILNGEQIPNRINDKLFSLEAQYFNMFGDFSLNSKVGSNISGSFENRYFFAEVGYLIKDDVKIKGTINYNSNAPNYNLLLNQSDYINYNWNNKDDFKNQNTSNVKLILNSKKLFDLSFEYITIDNFSFFSSEGETNSIKPKQLQQSLSLYKLKLDKEIKFGKFALDNSILYQNVNDESNSINLPDLVIRNTIYYSNHFFKNKALYLQTGITLNYFTKYYMDGYDPLLAEFYTQNQTEIGDFPRLDFFINAKIRQTRIFLKAEHFNSSFTGYNYFSAPNNPYRDFTVRFGLVWNFFL